jgi:hypothetical protein
LYEGNSKGRLKRISRHSNFRRHCLLFVTVMLFLLNLLYHGLKIDLLDICTYFIRTSAGDRRLCVCPPGCFTLHKYLNIPCYDSVLTYPTNIMVTMNITYWESNQKVRLSEYLDKW